MTYNPRINNLDNNIINISASLLVNKAQTFINSPSVVVTELTATTIFVDTLQVDEFDATLQKIQTNTSIITSSITASNTMHIILADASNSSINIQLPDISETIKQEYVIKKIDPTINNIIISGSNNQTIDGQNTLTISAQNDSFTIINDATSSWYII